MSTTEAITGAGSGTEAGTTPPGVENPGAMLDRDAFLKLLVAQLKYQDPTNPADSSQMLAQSAQLTMVDRMNELAASFETSAATQRLSLAGTIVGKTVSFIGPDGAELSAKVSSARVGADGLVLIAGDYEVPYAAITAVVETPAPVVTPPADEPATDPATDEPATEPVTEEPATEPVGDEPASE